MALPFALAEDDSQAEGEKETSLVRWLIETLVLIALAVALAFGIRTVLVEPFMVPTGSMIPTIMIGDRVLAEKITYRFLHGPRDGDIVVFPDPKGEHPHLIKRVIATEGETVDLRGGKVYVDGEELAEPYTHNKPSNPLPGFDFSFPFKVPEGHVWVMGDNRTNSADSRAFGPIDVRTIQGRGMWTYWPIPSFGPLE